MPVLQNIIRQLAPIVAGGEGDGPPGATGAGLAASLQVPPARPRPPYCRHRGAPSGQYAQLRTWADQLSLWALCCRCRSCVSSEPVCSLREHDMRTLT